MQMSPLAAVAAAIALVASASIAYPLLSGDDRGLDTMSASEPTTARDLTNGAISVDVDRSHPIAYVTIVQASTASFNLSYTYQDGPGLDGVYFIQGANEGERTVIGLGGSIENPLLQGQLAGQSYNTRGLAADEDLVDRQPIRLQNVSVDGPSDRLAVGLAVEPGVEGSLNVSWDGPARVQPGSLRTGPILLETDELDAQASITGRYGPTVVEGATATFGLETPWFGFTNIVLPSGTLEYCVEVERASCFEEDTWDQPIVGCKIPRLSGDGEVSLSMQSKGGSLFHFIAVPYVLADDTPTEQPANTLDCWHAQGSAALDRAGAQAVWDPIAED